MSITENMRFAVSALTISLTCVLLLAGCSGSGGGEPAVQPTLVPDTPTPGNDPASDSGNGVEAGVVETDDVYPYRPESPYAPVLKECVLVNVAADSCELRKLPFIGNGSTTPTVEQVMDRLLVTHDWMGERFKQVLQRSPRDLLGMFSSTTAVLIGSKVRPSFYTGLNGAIQLDPVYLWTSVAEKRTISQQEDSRTGLGDQLAFRFFTRVADETGSAVPYSSLSDDNPRPFEDILLPITRLLYHELTHAADFMPRWEIASVDNSLSVYDALGTTRDSWLSSTLVAQSPLASLQLKDLANVRFRTGEPTEEQQQLTAAEAGSLMATDGAMVFYGYSSRQEDLATLVEASMLAYHFDVQTNVGFVINPENIDDASCNDFKVGWGQRNRLADPLVRLRAKHATELVVATGPAIDNFFSSTLANPQAMQPGTGWCNSQLDVAAAFDDRRKRAANISVEALLREQQELVHTGERILP